MVAYTKPQQGKKEESEQLRGERDQIKFIYLRFERWQVVGFRKARRRQFHKLLSYLQWSSSVFTKQSTISISRLAWGSAL